MSGSVSTGLSIFFLSGAALAYEVILVRLLAMTRFHHLAFMVLSLALLAYGISGVLLAYLREKLLQAFRIWFCLFAALFAVGSVVCFQLSQRIPVSPAHWVWSPIEAINLMLLYLVLCLPLLAAASAVGLAYCRREESAGWIYRADLLGAALGSLGALAVLWLQGAQALWAPWCAGLTAAALMVLPIRRALASGLLLLAILGPITNLTSAVDLRLSPNKPLAMALDAEGGQVLADVFTSLGRLTVTRNTLAPFRHAPGLSLAFEGKVAPQWGLFTDGEGFEPLPVINTVVDQTVTHLDHLPEALAYHLASRQKVLLLETPVLEALYRAIQKKAVTVEAVLSNPGWRKIATDPALEAVGKRLSSDQVQLTYGDPRGFLLRADSLYDLISFGSPNPSALRAGHLHTVEAYVEALKHLAIGGVLTISGPSDLPPRAGLRLLTTATAALRQQGAPLPADHMVFIRSLRTVHLLVKKDPLSAVEIDAVRTFCRSRRFDPVWFPGMRPDEANRWNQLSEPLFSQGALQLLGPNGREFLKRYKFDLAPVTDDRPYFSRFLKPTALKEVIALRNRGALGLLSQAEPVLVATLVQALLFSLLAIWLPLRRFRATPTKQVGQIEIPPGGLFLFLGAGFMLAEFAVIEKMRLFLNEPVLAVGICLASFLALAGVGGGLSTRIVGHGTPALKTVGLITVGVGGSLLIYLAGLSPLTIPLMSLPLSLRLILAPVIIAPLALIMGLPFPLAMAALKCNQAESVPWAWGLNGCGALLGPVVGMGLAVYGGISAVLGAAVLSYGLAAITVLWRARSN